MILSEDFLRGRVFRRKLNRRGYGAVCRFLRRNGLCFWSCRSRRRRRCRRVCYSCNVFACCISSVIAHSLHSITKLLLQVCDDGWFWSFFTLWVHVAVAVEAVTIIIAAVSLAEQTNNPIVALRVVYLHNVLLGGWGLCLGLCFQLGLWKFGKIFLCQIQESI